MSREGAQERRRRRAEVRRLHPDLHPDLAGDPEVYAAVARLDQPSGSSLGRPGVTSGSRHFPSGPPVTVRSDRRAVLVRGLRRTRRRLGHRRTALQEALPRWAPFARRRAVIG